MMKISSILMVLLIAETNWTGAMALDVNETEVTLQLKDGFQTTTQFTLQMETMMGISTEPFHPVWAQTHVPAKWAEEGAFITRGGDYIYVASVTADYPPSLIGRTYLVKYSMTGDMIWNHTYTLNKSESSGILTGLTYLNGSIYFAGSGRYNTTHSGPFISRVSEDGTLVWNLFLGDNVTLSKFDPRLIASWNGFIYVAGILQKSGVDYDAFLMKIDEDHNLLWAVSWDCGSKQEKVKALGILNGYLYLSGTTWSKDSEETFLLKYDENGMLLWSNLYPDIRIKDGLATANDSIYMIVTQPEKYMIYLVRYDENGSIQWIKEINLRQNNASYGRLVSYNNSLYYIFSCMDHNIDLCIIKFDNSGSLLWAKNYTYKINSNEWRSDLLVLDEWEYYISTLIDPPDHPLIALMKGLIPTMPKNFTATGLYRRIHLAWSPPADTNNMSISSYRLYRNDSSGNFSLYREFPSNATNYTDTHLISGNKYCYMITTIVNTHKGEWSSPSCAMPYSEPEAPRNLRAFQYGYGDKKVLLTWAPPHAIGGSKITNYRIYRSESSGNERFYADGGNATSFIDSNVSLNKTYYYVVTAINDFGLESNFSNEANATPSPGGTVPDPPRNLRGSINFKNIALSWDPPLNDGGYEILKYLVYKGANQSNMKIIAELSFSMRSFNDTGLIHANRYHYQVSAVNALGESKPSNELVIEYLENRSILTGSIRDETNRGLVNVSVQLLYGSNDSLVKTVFSDTSGRFLIRCLFPGRYKIKIEAIGFKPVELQNISLQFNETKDIGIVILKKVDDVVHPGSLNLGLIFLAMFIVVILILITILLWPGRKNWRITPPGKNQKENRNPSRKSDQSKENPK